MGKLEAFGIQLKNQNGIFYSSQMVNGHVYVNLNSDMKMREIRLNFEGYSRVHWKIKRRDSTINEHNSMRSRPGLNENPRTDRTERTETYSAKETYFNMTGHPDKLPAGQHTFPFQFTLPHKLPSSFEHRIGQIRYILKATIDKPWKFDHVRKQPVTVVSLLDLNTLPEAARPLQKQTSRTLGFLCCESGPITGVLRIEKSGYVPGEAMYLQGEIENQSDTFFDVDVKLLSRMTFHATFKSRSEVQEVTKLVLQESVPGSTHSLSGRRIVIPPVPPSYLAGCKLIDMRYYLELQITSMSTRLVVPIEIFIGSVPLRSAFSNIGYPPSQPAIGPADVNVNFIPGAPNLPMPSPPDYTDMPPPSYAECVFGKQDMHEEEDNEHTGGQMSYAPAYPYYTFTLHREDEYTHM